MSILFLMRSHSFYGRTILKTENLHFLNFFIKILELLYVHFRTSVRVRSRPHAYKLPNLKQQVIQSQQINLNIFTIKRFTNQQLAYRFRKIQTIQFSALPFLYPQQSISIIYQIHFYSHIYNYHRKSMAELLLEDRIFWYVFLPIVYVTLSLSFVRMYYSKYNAYKATKKPIKQQGAYRDHQQKNMVAKCQLLIRQHPYLTQEAFNSRRTFLCHPETGYLTRPRQPIQNVDPMAQMQGMMDGMSGNLSTIFISIITIGWISYTFGGILIAKVPFNLSQPFKSITQSGVQMQNLNVQYISGISLYFFIMFGLGQLYNLFLRDEEDGVQGMQGMQKKAAMAGKPAANPMMNPMMPMNQQADQSQKAKDMFKSQIQNLSIVQHRFAFENCKNLAINRLKQFLSAN